MEGLRHQVDDFLEIVASPIPRWTGTVPDLTEAYAEGNMDGGRPVEEGERDSVDPTISLDGLSCFGTAEHDYARHTELEPVFSVIFPNLTRGMMASIHRKTKIAKATLAGWLAQFKRDPNWRPWDLRAARGEHHKIFSAREERMIVDVIEDEFLDKGLPMVLDDVDISVAFCTVRRVWPAGFRPSKMWASRFMGRWGYSYRTASFRRRPTTDAETKANFVRLMVTTC
jgi:hypothetical protein